ncbi:MAG: ferrochelatase [Solibacillus sp.]
MIAVIHYAYGAPVSIDNVSDYFSHILKGKQVPPPMLAKIHASFLTPGFADFIRTATEDIAEGLESVLNEQLDVEVKVYTAYKHTTPFLVDAIEKAKADGATTVVTLPINPIHSASGGGSVHAETAALLEGTVIEHIVLNNWHVNEGVVAVYAKRVKRAVEWLPVAAQGDAHVLFTVHSQPEDPERNAPYVQQFAELAAAIAKKAGVANFHAVYRSSGGKANWLAPDVKAKIKALHEAGATGFVTCELLSLASDVESYAEIGVECQEVCKELNVPFAVSDFPGASFDVVQALSALVVENIKVVVK